MTHTILVRAAMAFAIARNEIRFATTVTGGNAGPQRKRSAKQRDKWPARQRAKGRHR